jgi:hypothetical protein
MINGVARKQPLDQVFFADFRQDDGYGRFVVVCYSFGRSLSRGVDLLVSRA